MAFVLLIVVVMGLSIRKHALHFRHRNHGNPADEQQEEREEQAQRAHVDADVDTKYSVDPPELTIRTHSKLGYLEPEKHNCKEMNLRLNK